MAFGELLGGGLRAGLGDGQVSEGAVEVGAEAAVAQLAGWGEDFRGD